jgi:hypothetical protein
MARLGFALIGGVVHDDRLGLIQQMLADLDPWR